MFKFSFKNSFVGFWSYFVMGNDNSGVNDIRRHLGMGLRLFPQADLCIASDDH